MNDIERFDHDERTSSRVLQQYKGKPRYEALVGLLAKQADEIESALIDVYRSRGIDVATGASLLKLARRVVQPVNTDDADVIRQLIRTRIVARKSQGTINDALAVLRTFVPDEQRQLIEYYPASLVVHLPDDISDAVARATIGYLGDAIPGGVSVHLVYLPSPLVSGDEIRFSAATDWPSGTPTFSAATDWPTGSPVFAAVIRE